MAQDVDSTQVATMQAVSVQGTKNFRSPNSESVARLPLKNLENPTVFNVVPKEIMNEMNATDFNTAMASAPGVVVKRKHLKNWWQFFTSKYQKEKLFT